MNIKNNKTNTNFNKTNQLLNHLNLNNNTKVEQNMNSYINKNKPIRLNYNNDFKYEQIIKEIDDKFDDIKDYNINKDDDELIQNKIDSLKNKFGFNGSNEDFIKYLNIIRIKSDLVYLVENLFNDGENLDEENAEKCFYKLENLLNYKSNKNRNILNIYQFLVEKLLEINNLNKNII